MAQIVQRKDEIYTALQQLDRKYEQRQNQLHQQYERSRKQIIDDAHLELGRMLLTARAQVEAGETSDLYAGDWWGFFEAHASSISRSHAERWMAIAAKADPEAATIEYRARDAAYHRDYRQRKALPSDGERQMEMEPEPEIELPPARHTRDYLAEAAVLKSQILELMKLMRPIERTEFRRALIDEVEAMERTLNN
jgi:hypothetical protein